MSITHGASIADQQLKDLDGYSLCLAKVVNRIGSDSNPEDPTPVSNVVAASFATHEYGNKPSFQWTETYGMAANSTAYNEGDIILDTSTDTKSPFALQSLFKLVHWDDIEIDKKSSALKADSFGFNPVHDHAVCVLYLTDVSPAGKDGNPCYTSPRLLLPGPNNVEQITPSELVQVFFQSNGQTGSMKSLSIDYPTSFALDGKEPEISIRLDMVQGGWVKV